MKNFNYHKNIVSFLLCAIIFMIPTILVSADEMQLPIGYNKRIEDVDESIKMADTGMQFEQLMIDHRVPAVKIVGAEDVILSYEYTTEYNAKAIFNVVNDVNETYRRNAYTDQYKSLLLYDEQDRLIYYRSSDFNQPALYANGSSLDEVKAFGESFLPQYVNDFDQYQYTKYASPCEGSYTVYYYNGANEYSFSFTRGNLLAINCAYDDPVAITDSQKTQLDQELASYLKQNVKDPYVSSTVRYQQIHDTVFAIYTVMLRHNSGTEYPERVSLGLKL